MRPINILPAQSARDTNDAVSTRLRYRLQFERETSLFGVVTVPHLNAEPF